MNAARPKIKDEFVRKPIQIRLTDAELQRIEELKESFNCRDRSDYIRKAALGEIDFSQLPNNESR